MAWHGVDCDRRGNELMKTGRDVSPCCPARGVEINQLSAGPTACPQSRTGAEKYNKLNDAALWNSSTLLLTH